MNTFSIWLNECFLQWQKERGKRKTIVEWAEWLGVEQPTLSRWLNGSNKPRGASVTRLALKLGTEVYEVLGVKPKNGANDWVIADYWKRLNDETKKEILVIAERALVSTEGKPDEKKAAARRRRPKKA